jgi:hypothetical protein
MVSTVARFESSGLLPVETRVSSSCRQWHFTIALWISVGLSATSLVYLNGYGGLWRDVHWTSWRMVWALSINVLFQLQLTNYIFKDICLFEHISPAHLYLFPISWGSVILVARPINDATGNYKHVSAICERLVIIIICSTASHSLQAPFSYTLYNGFLVEE